MLGSRVRAPGGVPKKNGNRRFPFFFVIGLGDSCAEREQPGHDRNAISDSLREKLPEADPGNEVRTPVLRKTIRKIGTAASGYGSAKKTEPHDIRRTPRIAIAPGRCRRHNLRRAQRNEPPTAASPPGRSNFPRCAAGASAESSGFVPERYTFRAKKPPFGYFLYLWAEKTI